MAEKEYIEREAIEKAFAEEIRTNYLDDYANRKTIYDDIAVLTCFVNVKHWRHDGYWAEKGE